MKHKNSPTSRLNIREENFKFLLRGFRGYCFYLTDYYEDEKYPVPIRQILIQGDDFEVAILIPFNLVIDSYNFYNKHEEEIYHHLIRVGVIYSESKIS